jgi:hypothetical protein
VELCWLPRRHKDQQHLLSHIVGECNRRHTMLRQAALLAMTAVLCITYTLRIETSAGGLGSPSSPPPSPLAISAPDALPLPMPSPLPTPSPTPRRVYPPEIEVALQYIAEREGLPLAELDSLYQEIVTFQLQDRSYYHVIVTHNVPPDPKSYDIMVDLEFMTIAPDYMTLRAAEDAAYAAKYGKLNPSLYDKLKTAGDDFVLEVAIWVAASPPPGETFEDQVIARYPEARQPLEEKGVLWAVDDPQLASKIQGLYEELVTAEITQRVQPLKQWLEAQGYTTQFIPGTPVLFTKLPKPIIIAVSERPDVSEVYDVSEEAQPAAVLSPLDRASYDWGIDLRQLIW